MRKGKIAAYRRKSMVYGGLLGAAFGVVIGSMVGASLEAALTGFFGGLILGEMITYGRTFRPHHTSPVKKIRILRSGLGQAAAPILMFCH